MSRAFGVWLGLFVALGAPAAWVAHAEWVVSEGEPMVLALAPRDPRSLLQGDYMVLRYQLAQDVATDESWPRTGTLAVTLDEDHVVVSARRLDGALGPGERRLAYRLRDGALRLGAESWFFQEGMRERYEEARYGALRVDASGNAFLVGLRDADRRPISPAIREGWER